MKKVLKFLLNGGSALIFVIVAVNFFILNNYFGMTVKIVLEFTAYFAVFYLFLQGVQFNMQKVSSITDAALDLVVSAVPFLFMFYIVVSVDLSDNASFVRNIFFLTSAIDVFVFGWASLKVLLYTDRNAQRGD